MAGFLISAQAEREIRLSMPGIFFAQPRVIYEQKVLR
jgi:hypothetical protein